MNRYPFRNDGFKQAESAKRNVDAWPAWKKEMAGVEYNCQSTNEQTPTPSNSSTQKKK